MEFFSYASQPTIMQMYKEKRTLNGGVWVDLYSLFNSNHAFTGTIMSDGSSWGRRDSTIDWVSQRPRWKRCLFAMKQPKFSLKFGCFPSSDQAAPSRWECERSGGSISAGGVSDHAAPSCRPCEWPGVSITRYLCGLILVWVFASAFILTG